MNINFTERQIKMVLGALVALCVALAALAGYEMKMPTAPAPEIGAQSVSGPRLLNARLDGQTYTNGDLTVTGNASVGGDTTLAGDAVITGDVTADNITASGDIVVTGVITSDGGYVGNITPVATATARPHWCGAQNVTGAATVIPATLTAAGITTPRAPVASLGADITLDGNAVTVANASGVVTLKVWQMRTAATTTPQAATTAIAVNYCVDGN